MAFHKKNWHQRYQQMGDEAEQIFETVSPVGYVRTGLNRPPISVSALPATVRYMPDYLTSRCWVEVQGCGKDQIFKFKIDKLEALKTWMDMSDHPVEIFLWNKTTNSWHQTSLYDLLDMIYNYCEYFDAEFMYDDVINGFFDETKPWVGLPAAAFPGWRNVP